LRFSSLSRGILFSFFKDFAMKENRNTTPHANCAFDGRIFRFPAKQKNHPVQLNKVPCYYRQGNPR